MKNFNEIFNVAPLYYILRLAHDDLLPFHYRVSSVKLITFQTTEKNICTQTLQLDCNVQP